MRESGSRDTGMVEEPLHGLQRLAISLLVGFKASEASFTLAIMMEIGIRILWRGRGGS